MTIEEFIKIDPAFNSSMFLSKVNNIFVQLFTSVMLNELDTVDHFISDEVYNYYNSKVLELNKNNQRQMYEELNVKRSMIKSISKTDTQYKIIVYLEARYMDYILDLNTGNMVIGNNQSRIQENYYLEFVRNIIVEEQSIARKCKSCGAPMNVNASGKCNYCGAIYNQEDYDFILKRIEKI